MRIVPHYMAKHWVCHYALFGDIVKWIAYWEWSLSSTTAWLSVAADSQFGGWYISCVPTSSWLAVQASSEEPRSRPASTHHSEWRSVTIAFNGSLFFDCILSHNSGTMNVLTIVLGF